MAQTPPAFKASSDPKVGTGSSEPFSDAPIKNCTAIESRLPHDLRDGFTRKYFMQAVPDLNVPDEVNVWAGCKGKRSKDEGFPDVDSMKGRTVAD